MEIKGTYDFIVLAALLPIETILKLLPPHLKPEGADHDGTSSSSSSSSSSPSPFPSLSPLIPLPSSTVAKLGIEESTYDPKLNHPIVIQLGFQRGTGPGPSFLRMSFEEAKLEIPSVRHPEAGEGGKEVGFTFKQMILFHSRMMTYSSRYIAGLRSMCSTFFPRSSPSCYQDEARCLDYKVKGYLKAELTIVHTGLDDSSEEWQEFSRQICAPWFGANTKDMVTKFNYDLEPSIENDVGPIRYTYDLELVISSFFDPSVVLPKGGRDETLKLKGTALRFKRPYSSVSAHVSEFL
ncbi:hypothetical protein IE53DRAFT_388686 [Violaceomyces palustris]|uniref:Uncharacterized protein n=1 Tax=Violaceomyces palustris TaxID=1673888 RepID=A0ACD0NTJ6_9BASI|nr:hypothetical protein IE53DRAFT_388686 [Violaceomyces palustris]